MRDHKYMKKKWFVAKSYGWGWRPATQEGWMITIIYVLFIFVFFFMIDSHSHSVSDTLYSFLPYVLVLTAIYILICYKTGEKPRWQWGNSSKKKRK